MKDYNSCLKQYEYNLGKLTNPSDIKAFNSLKLKITSSIESNQKQLHEENIIDDLMNLATITIAKAIRDKETKYDHLSSDEEKKLILAIYTRYSIFKTLVSKLDACFQILGQIYESNDIDDDLSKRSPDQNFIKFVFQIFSLAIEKDRAKDEDEKYEKLNNYNKPLLYSNTLASGRILKHENLEKFIKYCDKEVDTPKLDILSKVFNFETRCIVELCIQDEINHKHLCRLIDNLNDPDHNITSSFYSKILTKLKNEEDNSFLFKTLMIKLFNLYKDEEEFLFSHNFCEGKNKWLWYDLLSHVFYDQILKLLMERSGVLDDLFDNYKSNSHQTNIGNLICKYLNVAGFREKFLETYSFIEQLNNFCIDDSRPQDSKEILIISKLALLQEFNILHENNDGLIKLSQTTCKLLEIYNFEECKEEDIDNIDLILQSLGLQSMLICMKKEISNYFSKSIEENEESKEESCLKYKSSHLKNSNLKLNQLSKIQILIVRTKCVSLEYSYLLFILNLMRSNDYDIIPSRSYEYCKSGK